MCFIVFKKRQKKSKTGIDLATQRYKELLQGVKKMSKNRFKNVWGAIEDTPEQAENMKLRSDLMMALQKRIKQLKLTQEQTAELLGVTQPRVSDLMRGKINLFALDILVNMTTAAGLHVEMRIKKMKKAA
jgi:predicted XRE-type DNA-binding protein